TIIKHGMFYNLPLIEMIIYVIKFQFQKKMAEKQKFHKVVYPVPPPIPEKTRKQIGEKVKSITVNGLSCSVDTESRQTNGYLSEGEVSSALSELSSSDHESSLDGWDNYQNSVADGLSENNEKNNQNGIDYSDNEQNLNFDCSDGDSIEPYYDHESPNENNNMNGVKSSKEVSESPFISSPLNDKKTNKSNTKPKRPPPEPPDYNNNNSKNNLEAGSIGGGGRNINESEDEKSINSADFEGTDDEYPSLNFIKSKIEEISKKKSGKWAILRDLQAENSEEPEQEQEPDAKSENGISTNISEKNSPPPKFKPFEVSLLINNKGKEDKPNGICLVLTSPIISNHERNDFRLFPNHTRNEPNNFSNYEKSETGPFSNHSRSELSPFPLYDRYEASLFSNLDRYESFLYSNHDRIDSGRFSNHERTDSGRFSNHERTDSNTSSFNRPDDDITAFHHQIPFSLKRYNEESSPPLGPLYKRPRPMSNGMHYSESLNHHNNSIYGPPPTGPSGMSGNGMMGRGREEPYPYYHRNDYRPNAPPPYIDRPGPYGRGHMNNNIPRRPSGTPASRPLTRPPDRPLRLNNFIYADIM
ncbi:4604_t:CDS:2, partial [Diversispora eburnea]